MSCTSCLGAARGLIGLINIHCRACMVRGVANSPDWAQAQHLLSIADPDERERFRADVADMLARRKG